MTTGEGKTLPLKQEREDPGVGVANETCLTSFSGWGEPGRYL